MRWRRLLRAVSDAGGVWIEVPAKATARVVRAARKAGGIWLLLLVAVPAIAVTAIVVAVVGDEEPKFVDRGVYIGPHAELVDETCGVNPETVLNEYSGGEGLYYDAGTGYSYRLYRIDVVPLRVARYYTSGSYVVCDRPPGPYDEKIR
jgi:hypothetical protein